MMVRSLTYTIYVVNLAASNIAAALTIPTGPIFKGSKGRFGVPSVDDIPFANVAGGVIENLGEDTFAVTYTVSSGGRVYVKNDDQIGPGGSSLTTSSGAPVWLDMNGGTRKVTVQAHVQGCP